MSMIEGMNFKGDREKVCLRQFDTTLRSQLREVALFIGKNPELALQEHKACAYLTDFLEDQGFQVERGVGKVPTAFVAKKGKGKPTVAFLAEYDALPGLGHACGHNLIATCSVGAAMALSQVLNPASGQIRVIGTPAEEHYGGKVALLKNGVFKGVDAAMMVHPDNRTEPIKRMLGIQEIKIIFHGKSAHASAEPEKGINALDAAVEAYGRINKIRNKFPKSSRIHGIFEEAGKAPNIIPDKSTLWYYVRDLKMEVVDQIVKRIRSIAQDVNRQHRTRVECVLTGLAYEPFRPNYVLSRLFSRHLKQLGMRVKEGDELSGIGSSDIGNVSQVIPAIHPMVRITTKGGCHTPAFTEAALSQGGFEAMWTASQALALTALHYFEDSDVQKEVKKEFLGKDK